MVFVLRMLVGLQRPAGPVRFFHGRELRLLVAGLRAGIYRKIDYSSRS
jgi:hypothetical protein